jgi:uncharacterized RDD family membrane protein YckC
MHGKYGQTLGKMACKVKVVDVSEQKGISMKQAFLRDIILIVFGTLGMIFMIPDVLSGTYPYVPESIDLSTMFWFFIWGYAESAWFFAEFITMLFSSKRRAVHDFIAGTVVIHKDRRKQLDSSINASPNQRKKRVKKIPSFVFKLKTLDSAIHNAGES